jgi:hypothetical protein
LDFFDVAAFFQFFSGEVLGQQRSTAVGFVKNDQHVNATASISASGDTIRRHRSFFIWQLPETHTKPSLSTLHDHTPLPKFQQKYPIL